VNVAVHDELMDSLAELRRALPSMRLGQLIANMATVSRGAVPGAIWEMEDDELLAAIRWQLQQLSSPSVANGVEQTTSDIKAKGRKRRRTSG
jgi:maltooligosyltrehalose synthase